MCVFPPLLPYNCKKVVTVNETFPGKKKKSGWVGGEWTEGEYFSPNCMQSDSFVISVVKI